MNLKPQKFAAAIKLESVALCCCGKVCAFSGERIERE